MLRYCGVLFDGFFGSMLHNHLKKVFRLNRNMGLAVLGIALVDATLMLTWDGWANWASSHSLSANALWGRAILALLYIGINEGGRLFIQRLPEREDIPYFLINGTIFISSLLFMAISYGLSGSICIGLMMLFPVMSAHFLGHGRLASAVLIASTIILIAGSLLSPEPFVYSTILMNRLQIPGVVMALYALPIVFLAFQFSRYVNALVQSSHTHVTRLQSLATTDGLTGLINRRLFNNQLSSEVARAKRHHSPLCLALFDIDDFKKLNDVYGHPVGDRILQELGSVIQHNIRECDIFARYGGEEFALILPETRQVEGADLMERIRKTVAQHVFCLPDNPLTISISVGVAQLDTKHHHSDALLQQADAALYEAKHQGKNRVVYGVITVPKVQYQSQAAQTQTQPHAPQPYSQMTAQQASHNATLYDSNESQHHFQAPLY